MGEENLKDYVVEKIKEVPVMAGNLWGEENVKDYVVEKFKEVVVMAGNLWGEMVGWIDKVFPPETRGEKLHHWIHVAAPFLIAGLVLVLCICCCRCCCCGRSVKMMKAPGRNFRMPRHVFEGNPRSYFQNLRSGNSIDQLC